MTKSLALVWALAVIPLIRTAAAEATCQTDLASIVVTPLARQAGAKADWQTIYDYSGGDVLPPGTRLTANGKWIDPLVRKDKSGVVFSIPTMPDEPQAAQFLEIGFADERPIANYPTRATIRYTSYRDQSPPSGTWWSPFMLTTGDLNFRTLSGDLRGHDSANNAPWPIHLKGENTLVFAFDGGRNATTRLNDQDASGFLKAGDTPISQNLPQPGAMLLPGLAIRNKLTQFPADKGDWFAINAFKVEQMRPPLDVSAVAAVDLTVPNSDPIRVTIEIVDGKNASRGYLLRDALVSPGKYRLYWDGIDQKQSMMKNTAWIGAGDFTFHLTTSKTVASYAGEINNSTPKYNNTGYGFVDCTALALTPPGTPVRAQMDQANYTVDTRKFDATDSIQLLCVGYDAKYGQWIQSDGSVIHTKTGDGRMQYGRGLTVTPPDSSDPTNPRKQFYFTSMAIGSADCIISCSLPDQQGTLSKKLTSPDWNRPPAAFQPYKIRLGRFPDLLGPQHYLFFQSDPNGQNRHAEWIFRNIRLYEEGSNDPGPTVAFDPAKFTVRARSDDKNPPPMPPGSLTVENSGRSVHLKNAIPVNYPFDYTVTPHTIMAFDVDVIDQSNCGFGNGIGLFPTPFSADEQFRNSFNFLGQLAGDARGGFCNPALGAYTYRTFVPDTLYTDSVGLAPVDAPDNIDTTFLWQPGFYGMKVSEDGKLLFACNNADHRVEVRDISKDGGAIAKIPVNYPMFLTWAPEGAAGAPTGTRFIYVDSPKEGILRIPWHTADNTFGRPVCLTTADEFAYPRGLTYDAVSKRLFVCDTFNYNRSKVANQIVVIDPQTGKVLSRFGKRGGVDPKTGGDIDEKVFTCPLNIEADSKGAFWINDYFTGEVRKYRYDPNWKSFKLERRVLGPNDTNLSHFFWMPGDPPTRTWTVGNFFIRTDADVDANGRFAIQRVSSANYSAPSTLRPYPHFTEVGSHLYGVFYLDAPLFNCSNIYELMGGAWEPRFKFGINAGDAARQAGLLAHPGQPPTDLDKAIAASGDKNWASRCWAWSDLDGDGEMGYSPAHPEFQIAFNSNITFNDYIASTSCFRASDGAYVHTATGGLLVITPKMVNGKPFYSWDNAKIVPHVIPDPSNPGSTLPASDILAQDGRFYVLSISTQRHDMGENVINKVECLDETGKVLWTREQDAYTLLSLQSLGDGMISILDRGGWNSEGPVTLRTSDGDLVSQIYCREAGDCWCHGALRSDADTAYLGLVQAYKVTGLSTVKTATVTVPLSAGGG